MAAPPIVIILGPPGAGKGTQAVNLAALCDFVHISPGELLRGLLKSFNRQSPAVKRELKKMQAGQMVRHALVFRLMFPRILAALKRGQGVLMDGAVRTLDQARGYHRFFKKYALGRHVTIVWIHISREESMRRLLARGRLDDTRATIARRLTVQGIRAHAPTLRFLRTHHYAVVTIDGRDTIARVMRRLSGELVRRGILERRNHGFVCKRF